MNIVTNVIITYQDKEQEFFDLTTYTDDLTSEYGLEKELVTNIANKVSYPNELVKISLCVYGKDNTKEVFKNKKLATVLKNSNGKYYFQPDQRSEVTSQICKEYPEIAKDTLSHTEWLMNQGLDPLQEDFNQTLINSFNHKRIDEFKEEYGNLITRTFESVFKKKSEDFIMSKVSNQTQKVSA